MLVRLGSVPGLLFFQSSISPSGGSSPGQVQMSNSWLAPLKSSLLLFLPQPEPPVNDGCQIWEWVRIHSGLFISARRCIHSFSCFSLIHSHERVCVKVCCVFLNSGSAEICISILFFSVLWLCLLTWIWTKWLLLMIHWILFYFDGWY